MTFYAGPVPMTEQHRPIKKLDFTPSSDELIRQINQAQLDDFDRRLAQSKKDKGVEGD
jgi:hypothetical protein